MGHYYDQVTATGKDRHDAEMSAHEDLRREQGIYCDIRETTEAELIGKVPPVKPTSRIEQRYVPTRYGRRLEAVEIIGSAPDTSAPESEWLEEWRFTIHYHI